MLCRGGGGTASEEHRRLSRTLQARSRSSHAMIVATDELQYLQELCRIVVEDCGHAMIWIGYAGPCWPFPQTAI